MIKNVLNLFKLKKILELASEGGTDGGTSEGGTSEYEEPEDSDKA